MSAALPPPAPSAQDAALADGLGSVIDRALERHPSGETFVYGIHQHVSAGVLEHLRRRYAGRGWGTVTVREGATGAHLLILTP